MISKILLLFATLTLVVRGAIDSDRITVLPGLVSVSLNIMEKNQLIQSGCSSVLKRDHVNFQQYAGYVTVNEETGKRFFYWFVASKQVLQQTNGSKFTVLTLIRFVESQNDPKNDPLIVWFNGRIYKTRFFSLFRLADVLFYWHLQEDLVVAPYCKSSTEFYNPM